MMRLRRRQATWLLVVVLGCGGELCAQTSTKAVQEPGELTVRLFGDGGIDRLTASRGFNAVLGKDSAPVFGGGVEIVSDAARAGWFVRVGAWRLKEKGERAVRLENQTFRLGIPLTVTITPVEASAGYRFPLSRKKTWAPYVGAGISSHGYKETSEFAEADENFDKWFTGYQVFGGLEYRLGRQLGVAGEVQYTAVPNAIGAGGMSAEFSEDDLGGIIFRARVLGSRFSGSRVQKVRTVNSLNHGTREARTCF
jgi:opacity protein-like surface antigen